MKGPGLRGRLLAAFVLVAVPPLLVLAAIVTTLVARSFERTATDQLQTGLAAAQRKLAQMRVRAEGQVAAVATEDLPAQAPVEEGDRTLADVFAQRRDLQALEILDASGRVISSHHFPAGFGLTEKDSVLTGEEALRMERVAEGYGAGERLALMPARGGTWRGAPITVRGGSFLDADLLRELSDLMGAEVALRDTARGRWVTSAGSALATWRDPPLSGAPARGDVNLAGISYRWTAAPALAGTSPLWLVVATPRTPVDQVASEVRSSTLVVAALALLSALVAALVLSDRIARPVRELAEGARRVAAGDLGGAVGVAGEDEIGDLARAFNAMTADLETSRERLLQVERVAAWREMARRLAHELKNPIFPIQLSIETLRRAFDEGRECGPLLRESSDTILEELRSLKKIIDEFSDFARMPRPQLLPTDVSDLVEQALALYRARAAAVRIETSLAADLPTIAADRDLLSRALGNLVANAIEAMPDGGTLAVRTTAAASAVSIEVEDTGPGLTEEQRTRLFTPYYTTKKGGTGLGLAIVQGIVSDHGGRIEVRSAPGKGTVFTLILPVSGSDAVREKL